MTSVFCSSCRVVYKTNRKFCPKCKSQTNLVLDENGRLTREFLLMKGVCCESGCFHCPWKKEKNNEELS